MADIFISYSKAYRALTEALAKELEARGHSVWWDTSLVSGETFREVILRELDAAKGAIVIWSPASVTSDWVVSEATRAKAQGKLIPVRSADLPHGEIPPPFDVLHTDRVDDLDRIEAAIAKLGVPANPGATPAKPRNKIRPKTSGEIGWRWLATAIVLVAIAGVGYFALKKKDVCTDTDWDLVQKAGGLSTLRRFASECFATRYGDIAHDELDRRDAAALKAAQAMNTLDSYQKYLEDWPNGHSALAAEQALSKLQATADAEKRRLQAVAESERQRAQEVQRRAEAQKRAQDEAAWIKADSGGMIADWQAYLKAFPEGFHVIDAKTKISERQKNYLVRTLGVAPVR
ncbi:MAG: toll/interleukin-1 receptor domain-containing protein [Rhodomicrobium sp.]